MSTRKFEYNNNMETCITPVSAASSGAHGTAQKNIKNKKQAMKVA